ncbi:MAG: SAM-dependent methyltransferase [Candidatus Dadabacteria bacterium]|nr:MAG: SAM-dependent methyltransferase [Candidatus Dadabacteria bacterium]
MSRGSYGLDDRLQAWLEQTLLREPPILAALREETAQRDDANMQISAEQGQWMGLLAKQLDIRHYLEVGVFTGYSSLSVMLAAPSIARATVLDRDPEVTAIAQRYWRQAMVEERIELHLGDAGETLQRLREQGHPPIDLAFIDADKENYERYYEHCLAMLRPGGLILVDNIFWNGAVADPERDDPDTNALRAFAAARQIDQRVDIAIVPIADGVLMLRKR